MATATRTSSCWPSCCASTSPSCATRAGAALRLLYDKFYEQNYPRDLRELRTLPGSVQDWDGDGQVEILYGLYDETGSDLWQTLLINAVTGEVKLTVDNYYPLTLDWLPGGQPVVFLAGTRGRGRRQLKLHGDMSSMELALDGAVHVFQFSGGAAHQVATMPAGELLLDFSARGFPLKRMGHLYAAAAAFASG